MKADQIVSTLLESREDELKDFALGLPKLDRAELLHRYFGPAKEHLVESEDTVAADYVYRKLQVVWDRAKPLTTPNPYIMMNWFIFQEPNPPDYDSFNYEVMLPRTVDVQAFLDDLAELEELVIKKADGLRATACFSAIRQKVMQSVTKSSHRLVGYAE